jgi:hypothetical protein
MTRYKYWATPWITTAEADEIGNFGINRSNKWAVACCEDKPLDNTCFIVEQGFTKEEAEKRAKELNEEEKQEVKK